MNSVKTNSEGKLCHAELDKELFETGKWADCRFQVGTEIFNAHKLMLSMVSQVFADMFYGNEPENRDPIPVEGMQADSFKAILEFVYTERIQHISSMKVTTDIFRGAIKYKIKHLEQKILKVILEHVNVKTAGHVYEVFYVENIPGIKHINELIKLNTEEVLSSRCFENLDPKTVKEIFSLHLLNISEIKVFQAAEKYVTAYKNRNADQAGKAEDIAAELLKHVHFLAMTEDEFKQGPERSSLLTEEQAAAILSNIRSKRSQVMPAGFSTSKEPRVRTVKIEKYIKQYTNPNKFDKFLENRISKERLTEGNKEHPDKLFQLTYEFRKENVKTQTFYLRGIPWTIWMIVNNKRMPRITTYLKCEKLEESTSYTVYVNIFSKELSRFNHDDVMNKGATFNRQRNFNEINSRTCTLRTEVFYIYLECDVENINQKQMTVLPRREEEEEMRLEEARKAECRGTRQWLRTGTQKLNSWRPRF